MTNIYPFDWPINSDCQAEVVVKTVYSMQETRQALELVQERKTVVLILDKLPLDQAQRVADWVAGGACATDGRTFWVGKRTLMFVPNQVSVKSNRPSISPFAPNLKTCTEQLTSIT
ncbi:hypothetical protein RGRSB_0103 [cyanobacterium endosymbiont of Rhopalodia gibberula]|uniref:cell division protein SepF n=1 Tax=cyanobacterium endosymbiont of Rhopalodia gibberula TaxID=1763363 RepID=UPI000DC7204B|nr:cell division protein SepF [cyanobacterium endosymbiont of Rhopalodia gibberula]BBA78730.1 hypothetical protein RGRSB_0103 [cyanobacterium endosymbiont of Rhopalodia gibberula]